MAEYWTIVREGPINSAQEALVGTKPTEGSKVLAVPLDATVCKIEGSSYLDAVRAARIIFGSDTVPLAAEVANVKES